MRLALLLALTLAACASDPAAPPADAGADTGTADTGAPLDTGPADAGQALDIVDAPSSDTGADAAPVDTPDAGVTCPEGFADCDGVAANGCERDTRTDTANCGGCARECVFGHATGACVSGACAVTVCEAGYGDCDGNGTNGCETDLRTTADCGACGMACPAPGPGATVLCVSGACVVDLPSCPSGRANCNAMAPDGCEVDLQSDLMNCGACGNRCVPTMNAATVSCSGGACRVQTCNGTYADCDGMASNGCEVNTNTSAQNCGACGSRCAMGQTCAIGRCE